MKSNLHLPPLGESRSVNLPQASEVDQVFLEGVENSIADSVLLADLSLADLHEPPSYSFNFWVLLVANDVLRITANILDGGCDVG
ncbi:hypothetical protein Nepgr_028849 [Nepenthes gracilis]|uniref:Uncharacterized protein n=1 Tax=Nepenthes gracilis TaxID=150966 RepID=A0AAD3TDT4_NEPGR|nr:hypothetical protein Nepgr_028849 [Nepenthes gracilis]